jgi:hypothetical protein
MIKTSVLFAAVVTLTSFVRADSVWTVSMDGQPAVTMVSKDNQEVVSKSIMEVPVQAVQDGKTSVSYKEVGFVLHLNRTHGLTQVSAEQDVVTGYDPLGNPLVASKMYQGVLHNDVVTLHHFNPLEKGWPMMTDGRVSALRKHAPFKWLFGHDTTLVIERRDRA